MAKKKEALPSVFEQVETTLKDMAKAVKGTSAEKKTKEALAEVRKLHKEDLAEKKEKAKK